MLLCVVIVLITVLAVITRGKSIQPQNLVDLLTSYSAYGVISVGCLLVIISGGIDISFMAVGAVAQYITALFMLNVGGNFITAYLISAAVGAVFGIGNAILVNRLHAPTMIITIGTMNIIYGITMRVTRGIRLHGFPTWFSQKTKLSLLLVSVGTLAAVLLLAADGMSYHKQQAQQQCHQNGDGHIAGTADDAGGNGPEHKCGIGGLLHGGTETDDGQRTHHAQAKDHVGGDDHDHQRSDHGEHHQAGGKIPAVIDPGIGGPVNEYDEQAQDKGQRDGGQGAGQGNGREFLKELAFENISKSNHRDGFLSGLDMAHAKGEF